MLATDGRAAFLVALAFLAGLLAGAGGTWHFAAAKQPKPKPCERCAEWSEDPFEMWRTYRAERLERERAGLPVVK